MDYGWCFEVQQALELTPPNPTTASLKIPYSVNSPKLTQVVTGKNFHYFKLRLYDINEFFLRQKKSWNRNYPPAQQIYSDSPISVALRAAIHTEHAILYSNREGRGGNDDGFLDRSPNAFFDLLEHFQNTKSVFSPVHTAVKEVSSKLIGSKDTKDKIRIYTYVLLDDSLRFSRSGAGTTVDFSSKHALHAGAATEVHYAGEFWVENAPIEGRVLYLDNNSGTFAPPEGGFMADEVFNGAEFSWNSNSCAGLSRSTLEVQTRKTMMKIGTQWYMYDSVFLMEAAQFVINL